MNLLLLKSEELENSRVLISDERALHIIKVLKSKKGHRLNAGILNGQIGYAVVKEISEKSVTVEFSPESEPPKPADITLILALPRPKAFRRILFAAVSAGVKDIRIINSWRVEKSYWDSPYISPESIKKISEEALMQAKDTVMPEVHFYRFFMEFIEEGLPSVPSHRQKIIAHPYGSDNEHVSSPAAVAVGPEGGFVERELETFVRSGFKPFSPIDRILTTEHFVPFILGKLEI